MDFIELALDVTFNVYCYKYASNMEMNVLGLFLSKEIRCMSTGYAKWAVDDSEGMGLSGNIIRLEKEGNYIFLSDLYNEKEDPTELKLSRQQFVQLLDEWQEKVCKSKPKTVIIKCENDQFIIETSDN